MAKQESLPVDDSFKLFLEMLKPAIDEKRKVLLEYTRKDPKTFVVKKTTRLVAVYAPAFKNANTLNNLLPVVDMDGVPKTLNLSMIDFETLYISDEKFTDEDIKKAGINLDKEKPAVAEAVQVNPVAQAVQEVVRPEVVKATPADIKQAQDWVQKSALSVTLVRR